MGEGVRKVMPVVEQDGVRFFSLNVKCRDLTELLTGDKRTAMGHCSVWRRLRDAIAVARDNLLEAADAAPQEDLWAEPDLQTPKGSSPNGGRRLLALLQHRSLTIDMPEDPQNLDAGTIALRVKNDKKTLGLELTEASLSWLHRNVQRELRQVKKDAEFV